MKIDHKKIIDF